MIFYFCYIFYVPHSHCLCAKVTYVGWFACYQSQCLFPFPPLKKKEKEKKVAHFQKTIQRLLARCFLCPTLFLSYFGHHSVRICFHASFLSAACCKGCRHSNVFHVAVINMLIFLISHLKAAVSFCFPQSAEQHSVLTSRE